MEQQGKPNKVYPNPPIFDVEKVAAASECTGLVPSAVGSEAEGSTYADLYGIHIQKPTKAE